jgi:hypothetical protein
MPDFSVLVGKTLSSLNKTADRMVFICTDGSQYLLYHRPKCCESVVIHDIAGDLNDLIGTPILLAEESSSSEHPLDYEPASYMDSYTWTFYRLQTIKGLVVIRWLGESNGYYSESVDFEDLNNVL